MDCLSRWANERPDRVALLGDGQRLTYAQYKDAVIAVSDALAAAHVPLNAPVAVVLPKSPALAIAYLGAAAWTAVPFPVDYKGGAAAWRSTARAFSPASVLTVAGAWPPAGVAAGDVNVPILMVDKLIAAGPARPSRQIIFDISPLDLFYYNLTSGASGRPRAAAATHANVLANAVAANAALGLGAEDVHLCTFAAHAHPHETFARALVAGGAAAFVESILPRTVLNAVASFRVTALMGVPPLFRSLIPLAGAADTSSLRVAEAGGMTTPAALLADFRAAFGLPLTRVWGSTETSGIAFVAPADAPEGAMGRPIAGYEARVLGEAGAEVGVGDVGELTVGGPACVADVGGAAERFRDGFVRTRDYVRREADGSFTFVDRAEGLMKVAGEKVYAAEVERALRAHPAVAEAAVLAEADDVRGQVPVAYVVPFPHLELTPAAVAAFVRESLPAVKRPRRISIVPDLPHTGSGKVDKIRLGGAPEEALGALAVADGELLQLLNRRARLLRELGDAFGAAEAERFLARLAAANRGPLHDETVEEIFRKLNELMGG